MANEDIEVSADHILLASVMDKREISAKQVAVWTGRGTSTIYKYLSGEATIPSIVWRALYERTQDPQIITLLTGQMPVYVVPLTTISAKADSVMMAHIIKTRKAQLKCEELVLDILKDDKIDQSDAAVIENYKKIFPESIILQQQLNNAITGGYTPLKNEMENP